MNQPLVSVVIATYNMGRYLPEAINSVLGQSWQNLEVVVVDDGSKDDTAEQMVAFENEPRVRYIPTENRGQPKAKNRGLKEAHGQFIAFCDADDLWRPDKLAVQMPLFADPKVGVVYSEVSYIDKDGLEVDKSIPYKRHSGWVTEQLVIKNFVPFGTAVIRRACLDQDGMFDEDLPMGIDWDLWLRYSVRWQFMYSPEITYIYRIWEGQMSKNYRGRYENAFRILDKFLTQHPGAVSSRIKSRAWSDMYVSRGMSVAHAEKKFVEPMIDVLTSLRYDSMSWPAWKSMAKLILRKT